MSVIGLIVRSGSAADLAAVFALERAVGEAPRWGESEYLEIVRSQENMTGAQDAEVRRCFFVAERTEMLVGFAVAKVIGAGRYCEGELESVVVRSDARRNGVAMALCGVVVEWCRREGATELALEVRAGSAGAIALYGALGFVTVGKRRGYYPGIHDPGQMEAALLMRLELAKDE